MPEDQGRDGAMEGRDQLFGAVERNIIEASCCGVVRCLGFRSHVTDP
jgi:hypothetical protein